MAGTQAGLQAFREAYVTAEYTGTLSFEDYNARIVRYDILASSYENTAYRNIHRWAQSYKSQYGLYKYVRNVYNPTYRLVEFYKMMIWGGLIDLSTSGLGAIPIEAGENADEEKLLKALRTLYRDSNWQVNKDILVLRGAMLGDTLIKVVDNPDRKHVRLEITHPASLKEAEFDERGFIQSYTIEDLRIHPDSGKTVTYTEIAERDEGSEVIYYSTFANGKPFAWNGKKPEWNETYGFVPLVAIQHNNVGLDYGWSEAHPLRSKIHEADDMASKIDDYVRKLVDAPALITGMNKPSAEPKTTTSTATSDRPEPGREEIPTLYASDPNARYFPMVAPLDIAAAAGRVDSILQEMERDFPELQMDIWSVGTDVSGKALRTARQRAEAKVIQRRPNYDAGLVRANQMAIAIGGMRGYEGYQGYSLDSYKAGQLEHYVAGRPVFPEDPRDELDRKKIFWDTVAAATKDGKIPVETVLRDLGWTDDQLVDFGTQKLAAIHLQQADTIPPMGQ